MDRSVQPAYYVDPIFNLTAIAREQYQVIKVLHNFTENVIREREKNFNDDDFKDTNTHTKKRLAMLDLLLYAKRQRGEINDRGIREEVDTFMFEVSSIYSINYPFTYNSIRSFAFYSGNLWEFW